MGPNALPCFQSNYLFIFIFFPTSDIIWTSMNNTQKTLEFRNMQIVSLQQEFVSWDERVISRRSRLRADVFHLASACCADLFSRCFVINISPSVFINDPLRYLQAVTLTTQRCALKNRAARLTAVYQWITSRRRLMRHSSQTETALKYWSIKVDSEASMSDPHQKVWLKTRFRLLYFAGPREK